jgi:hypothetical protein
MAMRVRRWLSGLAVLVLLGVAVTGAATVAIAMPQGEATFSDSEGDSRGGPDVTRVVINDDATLGTINITVIAPGYRPASPDAFRRNVSVWLDTDKNRATGDPEDGTEYGLSAWNESASRYWNAERWYGSDWEDVSQSASMSFHQSGDVLTWTLNKSDLGAATSFRFYVHACIWDTAAQKHIATDEAPDSGWWDYSLSRTTPTPVVPTTPAPSAKRVALQVLGPETTPRSAVAGKRFTVSFLAAVATEQMATKVDIATGKITTVPMTTLRLLTGGGKMVCDPSVQGKVITHSESFKNGTARLSFVIPKTAKGKVLKVNVKLTVKDSGTGGSGKTLTTSRVATFRVR